MDAAARVFQHDALTVGFARRVATYKRLYLIAGMPDESLLKLLGNDTHPIQLILAGKAHPSDDDAKATLRNTAASYGGLSSDRDVWVYHSSTAPIPVIRNEELILIYAEANILNNTLPNASCVTLLA